MITKKLKLMLLPLVALASLSSCSKDPDYGNPQTGSNQQVVFSLSIPANHVISRALSEDGKDEYEVRTFDVLLFDNSAQVATGDPNGTLLSRATHSGTPVVSGQNLDIYIKLEKDDAVTGYDFILLANSRDLITSKLYSGGKLRVGMTKAEVQQALRESVAPEVGWIANTSSSEYKAMPMWGELNNQEITAGKTYARTTLLRATVKVDLEVALENASNTFLLEEVWYYNYNTEGFVIPLAAHMQGGKAKTPTIGGLTLEADPINYSGEISTDKKSLKNAMYGFEGPEGSLTDYANNPTLIIKGSFNGTSGWYRFDFANVNPATLATTYLPLLRNHHYKMYITAINGPGYTDKQDAINSKPGNVGTEITVWDGENVNGHWNGNYEIQFSGYEANFSQFATPTPQVITIKTNVPELVFENFTNISKGTNDLDDWVESPTDTWTNDHFTVVIGRGTPSNGYTDYTLAVTAKPTVGVADDPARDSRFKVKGKNMEANIQLTQDAHAEFRLIATPDPANVIHIDGKAQYIPIHITSTHPYQIVLNDNFTTMFDLAASDMSGTVLPAQIGTDVTTIYVHADVHADPTPRVGEFTLSHCIGSSAAAPITYSVVQKSSAITAQLTGASKYAAEIPRAGGTVTIEVKSNLDAWIPVLERQSGSNAKEDLNGVIGTYFTPASGSANQTVTFELPAMGGGVTEDDVYYITFKDANGETKSDPVIQVTHQALELGRGGGGYGTSGGILAPANILAVDKNGILNLDGPAREENYMVYYKWGSTIAIAGGDEDDPYDYTRIAWVPVGYTTDLTTLTAWANIPYIGDSSNPDMTYLKDENIDYTKANPANGIGDPCRLAVKDGSVGIWRMPVGVFYNGYNSMGAWATVGGTAGRYNTAGNQFYPAAGVRNPSNGALWSVASEGFYWMGTRVNSNMGRHMRFDTIDGNEALNGNQVRSYGFAIRCVPQ